MRQEPPIKITVETTVNAPIQTVWDCWTNPDAIQQWNAASDDWHTTAASVDLREGGAFSSRMEAKDGSMGFDFAGEYTRVDAPTLIESRFGDRSLRVTFEATDTGVVVREEFDSETDNDPEMQKAGWQAILDNFKRYVETRP